MRSDLEKLKGIKDITTDFKTNIATFKIAMPQADLKQKLDGFAKTNEHMKDWSFMDPKKDKKESWFGVPPMDTRRHWDGVYWAKGDSEVSWTQQDPRLSLDLIRGVLRTGGVIDVGGGASSLAGRLLDAGYAVAVLDLSAPALERAKARLGPRAASVGWIVADVTEVQDVGRFDLWHDRAAFHFLTQEIERERYVSLLRRTVPAGGHAVIATFAPDGPSECSGLDVVRYSGESLALELGPAFERLRTVPETHVTPRGKPQSFQYSVFRHWPAASAEVEAWPAVCAVPSA